jgi:sulfur carrier protein ThiS
VLSPAVFETAAVDQAWLPQHKKNSFKSLIKGFFIWVSIRVKITVSIEPDNTQQEITVQKNSLVSDLLNQLHMKPDSVIILRGSTPIPVDEPLTTNHQLKIIRVASGG